MSCMSCPGNAPIKTPEEWHIEAMAQERLARETENVTAAMKRLGHVWDTERTLVFGLTISDNKLVGLKSGLWLGVVFGFWLGVFAALWMVQHGAKFGGVKP